MDSFYDDSGSIESGSEISESSSAEVSEIEATGTEISELASDAAAEPSVESDNMESVEPDSEQFRENSGGEDMEDFALRNGQELNISETDGAEQFREDSGSEDMEDFVLRNGQELNISETDGAEKFREDSGSEDMEGAVQLNSQPVDKDFRNDFDAKVLQRSEYDLLTTGNRNNDMILDMLREDYQDKGLSEEEINQNLALDEVRLQREFLDDAFPEQNIPTEVFDSIKNGAFSRDEWFGKNYDVELTEEQKNGIPELDSEPVEGGEGEYENFYKSINSMELSDDFKKTILERFDEMDPDLKAEYNEYADRLVCLDSNYYEVNEYGVENDVSFFSPSEGGFKFNQELDERNPLGAGNTFFHESAHMIDWLKGHDMNTLSASEAGKMTDAAIQDYSDAIARVQSENGCSIEEAESIISDDLMSDALASNTVSDVFGGLTYNRVTGWYTHGKDYWYERPREAVGMEAFAEITADRACGKEHLKFTSKYLPHTMEAYENVLKMKGENR